MFLAAHREVLSNKSGGVTSGNRFFNRESAGFACILPSIFRFVLDEFHAVPYFLARLFVTFSVKDAKLHFGVCFCCKNILDCVRALHEPQFLSEYDVDISFSRLS